MSTQSTTTTEATAPTGDIKIFIDTFNSDFDKELKRLSSLQDNLKNIYSDAIKITTPRTSTWPKDANVVTIGDLFKYTFPDITTNTFIQPPKAITSNGFNATTDEAKLADLKSWEKDFNSSPDIKEKFDNLKRGLGVNTKISTYESIKKPGITNPSLYSAGQYYFDIFMYKVLGQYGPFSENSRLTNTLKLNKMAATASISLFSNSGDKEEGKLLDYIWFSEYVVSDVDSNVDDIAIPTDLNNDGPGGIFPSLKTQYRSGKIEELKKDPTFNENRGELQPTTSTSSEDFIGFYENLLLYKAFIQAGDNYKSVVLPYRNPEPIAPVVPQEPVPTVAIPTPLESEYVFNVEKIDTFIFVSGTPSIPIELTIIPNDGTTYIYEEPTLNNGGEDELGEEYQEGGFAGTEEEIAQLAATAFEKENLQGELPADATGSTMTVESYDFNDPKYIGDAWKSYDINKAVDLVNKTSTKPSSKFVDSLKKVLYLIKNDPDIKDLREAAYMLGTAYAESGYSLQRWEADYACTGAGIPYGPGGPCSSATSYYRSTKGGKRNYYELGTDSKGQCFFGRGLIQLTGKGNYEKYGKLIGANLLGNGDLAMDPINSYKVASVYMRGRTFKHVLAGDLTRARKSVNGGTKGINEVNSAYNNWVKILKDSVGTVA